MGLVGGAHEALLYSLNICDEQADEDDQSSAVILLLNQKGVAIEDLVIYRDEQTKTWQWNQAWERRVKEVEEWDRKLRHDINALDDLEMAYLSYFQETQRRPERLEDLVPDYIEKIPIAQSDGKVFTYTDGKIRYGYARPVRPTVDAVLADLLMRQQIAVALKVYHAREGRWPDDLGELVPQDMIEMPESRVEGMAFSYRPQTGEVSYNRFVRTKLRYIYNQMHRKACDETKGHALRTDEQTRLILTVMIHAYEHQNGKKPEQLDDLVPEFITHIPDLSRRLAVFNYDPKTGEVSVVDQK